MWDFSAKTRKVPDTLGESRLFFFLIYQGFFFSCFVCTAQHVGSNFPHQGSNPCPLHWQHRVLTTGPPGKCLEVGHLNCTRWPLRAFWLELAVNLQ